MKMNNDGQDERNQIYHLNTTPLASSTGFFFEVVTSSGYNCPFLITSLYWQLYFSPLLFLSHSVVSLSP